VYGCLTHRRFSLCSSSCAGRFPSPWDSAFAFASGSCPILPLRWPSARLSPNVFSQRETLRLSLRTQRRRHGGIGTFEPVAPESVLQLLVRDGHVTGDALVLPLPVSVVPDEIREIALHLWLEIREPLQVLHKVMKEALREHLAARVRTRLRFRPRFRASLAW
jgi:hypothetical protein